jgi:hypothetical protein
MTRRRRRDDLEPPTKEMLRQQKKRILDKYPNGRAISDKDKLALAEIWAWQHHPREMEKIHAGLVKAAISQIAEEIALRFQAKHKLLQAAEEYLRVTKPPKS